MSRSAPLSPIMSMNRIVPAIKNRSIALSMNKFELLIISRKCKTVTNTINPIRKYSVEFEKVCKPGKEEKCVTVIDVVNEQTYSPTTERMCTNVIEEMCSSDEEQDCNTVINKKCHEQNCNEHRGKV